MSPLFGHRQDEGAPSQAAASTNGGELADQIERLDGLPLAQLASEVMTKGFGPGGPGADEDGSITIGGPNVNAGPTISDIATELVPGVDGRGVDEQLLQRLFRLVGEALQVLEHASLIRTQMHTSMNSFDYALTRLGRQALERGEVDRLIAGRG